MPQSQGGRVASGLGPVTQAGSLRLKFAPIAAAATPSFFDAVQDVESAAVIPDVRIWGEGIYERASDEKQFGLLKNDCLSVDGIAFLMGECAAW